MVELRRWRSIPTYCRSIGVSSSCRGVFGNPSVARGARIFTRGGGPAPSSHQEWGVLSVPVRIRHLWGVAGCTFRRLLHDREWVVVTNGPKRLSARGSARGNLKIRQG